MDPSDEAQCKRLSVKPATLPSIFDVFVKTREKMGTAGVASSPASASTSIPAEPKVPSEDDKAAAEKLKAQGNAKMSSKDYDAAIDFYTLAIAKDGNNAIYYSNRAAAYSSKSDYANAVKDAGRAIEIDPDFVRAYHRLGLVPLQFPYVSGWFSSRSITFMQSCTLLSKRLQGCRRCVQVRPGAGS